MYNIFLNMFVIYSINAFTDLKKINRAKDGILISNYETTNDKFIYGVDID